MPLPTTMASAVVGAAAWPRGARDARKPYTGSATAAQMPSATSAWVRVRAMGAPRGTITEGAPAVNRRSPRLEARSGLRRAGAAHAGRERRVRAHREELGHGARIGRAELAQHDEALARALGREEAVGEPRRVLVEPRERRRRVTGAQGAVRGGQERRLSGGRARGRGRDVTLEAMRADDGRRHVDDGGRDGG